MTETARLELGRRRPDGGREVAVVDAQGRWPASYRARLNHRSTLSCTLRRWWQQQFDLCIIGVMATFGWEKALGDTGELSWWEQAAAYAATRQRIPIPR